MLAVSGVGCVQSPVCVCMSCDLQSLSACGARQDSQDPNPLIRALAVRTMGCIRVDKITEYLCDPLQRCLKVPRRS